MSPTGTTRACPLDARPARSATPTRTTYPASARASAPDPGISFDGLSLSPGAHDAAHAHADYLSLSAPGEVVQHGADAVAWLHDRYAHLHPHRPPAAAAVTQASRPRKGTRSSHSSTPCPRAPRASARARTAHLVCARHRPARALTASTRSHTARRSARPCSRRPDACSVPTWLHTRGTSCSRLYVRALTCAAAQIRRAG
jgi:hypothetical protein